MRQRITHAKLNFEYHVFFRWTFYDKIRHHAVIEFGSSITSKGNYELKALSHKCRICEKLERVGKNGGNGYNHKSVF